MTKYARLVFEEEIPEGTTNEEIVDKMEGYIENYIKNGINIDDIEISESPDNRRFILNTSMSHEDVEKQINEFKKYCQETDTSYGSEDFLAFLSHKGIDASIVSIK